jgi:hypothetical protein
LRSIPINILERPWGEPFIENRESSDAKVHRNANLLELSPRMRS